MPEFSMKNYYDEGRYAEAIAFASDAAKRNAFSEWDYLFLSKCLYKLKRYEDYLERYKEFHD